MYELILSEEERELFKKAAKVKMIELNMDSKKLAEITGYSLNSIYSFFSHKDQGNRFIAASIAVALELKEDWRTNEGKKDKNQKSVWNNRV